MQTLPPPSPGTINLSALPTLINNDYATILEIGAHNGFHSRQFLQLFPFARRYAFEPDSRARAAFKRNIRDLRAVLFNCAIGAKDGFGDFFQSTGNHPDLTHNSTDWDHSGSIRPPTGHLKEQPWCKFLPARSVRIKTLDSVVDELGIDVIDFLWADVQGAEIDMIRGGKAALERTRYIFTEYSDKELYMGQVGLEPMLTLLPYFKILVRFTNDVLLWNSRFPPPPPQILHGSPNPYPQSSE